ncbi:protein CHROMATIN REMODELING 24-like isoform X1 [Papaver somniferum]|uniref:protein CHROMATIN REMODELING 24-like isoform X1 n=1 Tax=Papaver somniferum TaxID=3469 RepID=UPI000E701085|nr:protein CHROMATIN REMODELING 24-like isoform X1 [Papaver somniferum]
MAEKHKPPLSLNDRLNQSLRKPLHRQQPHPSSYEEEAPSIPPEMTAEEEESKPQKVKVQGRRRLCKFSSKEGDDDDDSNNPVAGFDDGEGPSFGGIMDAFDSPPPRIRDIVDELSSKLDFLSMEKPTRKVVATGGGGDGGKVDEDISYTSIASQLQTSSLRFTNNTLTQKVQDQTANGNVDPEFGSAGSSFSNSPDVPPNSLLEKVHSQSRISFVKSEDIQQKKDSPKMDETAGFKVSGGEDDSDDDCIVISNKTSNKLREIVPQTRATGFVKEERETNFISDDDEDEYHDVLDKSVPSDSSAETYVHGDPFILSWKTSNFTLPGEIAKKLYPHQLVGLKWLWSLHCRGTGGILGDDMGLGKTMQICSYLAGLFNSHLIKRVLVVAPKTLIPHWIKELSVVGLSRKTKDYYSTSLKLRDYELQYVLQNSGILLTTYDIVRNNSKSIRGGGSYNDEESEESIIWEYVILDEGHIIKNPSTQRAKSLLEIPCPHRIVISGTPIQNNLKELWALFSVCSPQLLGDKKEFKERYEAKILRGNEKNATDREKRIGSTVAKELREQIEPYFLRRMKSEVSFENGASQNAKLSEKNEIIVWLKLTHCQRQLYEAFLSSEVVLSSFDGSPLAAITVLKKICDHPLLLTKRAAEDVLEGIDPTTNQEEMGLAERIISQLKHGSDIEDAEKINDMISCKISFIVTLLENLIPKGHNVLIFSQTRKMLNLVQDAILAIGYNFLRIDGTTKAVDRQKIVNDFQEGRGAPIFLLTSQVGGLGLTLTKADRVIVVDPAWNPSTDNQSVDRAYRIGQKKDVIVYRLMTCGTIEEKIYKMQVFKGALMKSATEHKEQTRYFSRHDLQDLFSLPKQGFDVSLTQQQLLEEHDSQHQMSDSLKDHIKFLESQGIAGVSHHSLLFSKTAPVPEDVEVPRSNETYFVGTTSSISSVEHNIDKPEFAFNPKDVKVTRKNSPAVVKSPTESEVKDRINRLNQTLSNKGIISKLPDKGQKIERQIVDLNLELDKIKMAKESNKKEVIDLDDLSDGFQRVSV